MTNPEPINSDQQLWAAVIMQALEDAAGAIGVYGRNQEKRDKARATIRLRARNWFIDAKRDFADVCALAGLDPDRVRTEALKRMDAFDNGKRKRKGRVMFEGEELTIAELSNRTGLPRGLLYSRCKNGITGDALLAPSGTHSRARTYTFNGETHTIDEWGHLTGIPSQTIRSRLKAEWPIEKALTKTAAQSKKENAERSKAALKKKAIAA